MSGDLESIANNMNGCTLNQHDKSQEATEEDVVNPWDVVSKSDTGIDYDKLIST